MQLNFQTLLLITISVLDALVKDKYTLFYLLSRYKMICGTESDLVFCSIYQLTVILLESTQLLYLKKKKTGVFVLWLHYFHCFLHFQTDFQISSTLSWLASQWFPLSKCAGVLGYSCWKLSFWGPVSEDMGVLQESILPSTLPAPDL